LSLVFGKSDYKGKQKEIMEAAVQGADILVVAPTGMGKVSSCTFSDSKADITLF
jgi:superfamily II DNA helicase RecQ